jgi:hypothetical protein
MTTHAYPIQDDMAQMLAHESYSDLGQSFSTTKGGEDWELENSEEWGSMPNGGMTTEDEKTAGPDGLVADGAPEPAPSPAGAARFCAHEESVGPSRQV